MPPKQRLSCAANGRQHRAVQYTGLLGLQISQRFAQLRRGRFAVVCYGFRADAEDQVEAARHGIGLNIVVAHRAQGKTGFAVDAAGGLDTGVFVIPFFAIAEMQADPTASRAQYLPTLDTQQLQLRGTSFGANVSTLEILTNSVVPTNANALYLRGSLT